MNLERIPNQTGYLVLTNDGAVIASGGDLENAEHTANIISELVSLADKVPPHKEGYKKLTVTYSDHCYIILLSNKKLYVVKKKLQPVSTSSRAEADQ
ncbi:unnamed protein product [Bemisia tabaci]|uniref:Late endosomal/lysosomal adaptor and MAPK and MTOR activator 4 n=1 Tax=Bemisia tabaci TaxID=7038 RepID=A0A9P0A0W2_BEMTA|nr:PREDICTED: ragulator complex protein LAMTOR4 [Bemisia tabaci]CAH0381897.1 unnamed protein product [Bemisia tabaci]